ncbi:MAG: NAD(P)-binding domain-containing protein [Symploca sp. SIO3E6]|nr:NAD(P)-binding domain-containing protein [Caldora sp. SIO3E6]
MPLYEYFCSNKNQTVEAVIVGAGAAGVGCGVVLKDLGLQNFILLERHEVGASFNRWPAQMRFITPSFPSHGFGLLDLNAVALNTSPALSFRREHITGKEYALYLQTIVEHFQLPVKTGIEVRDIEPLPEGKGFILKTSQGDVQSRFVIWAAGEFQYPRLDPFPGTDLCIHNTQIRSWDEIQGEEFIVIGGYESGMDAATNLVALGKRVGVIDRAKSWASDNFDPSISLSPYTLQRLEFVYATGRLELVGNTEIVGVKRDNNGYVVVGAQGNESIQYRQWMSPTPPILCTGFKGSLSTIAHLFHWSDGHAVLNEWDESTLTPGLFVVGPSVRHEDVIFCFIYKFRQRFAVVADAIAQRLGLDPSPLQVYREQGLFLDDLSCCDNDCVC